MEKNIRINAKLDGQTEFEVIRTHFEIPEPLNLSFRLKFIDNNNSIATHSLSSDDIELIVEILERIQSFTL